MFTAGDKLEYGHYTVLRELGAGGMGVVYHCRDEFLQREIAIKMLLPELMADDDTVEVFRQEARLAAQLEHPNVVTIHNIGIENKEGKTHHYIAMEFLPGGSLKNRIDKDVFIPLEQCLEWMKQMTIGLNYAHKRGVVHQDIKPDNIFITHDHNLKIGDFGLALIATGVAVERAVQGKGTPAYMSPELCRGDAQDHRSDIYSLGAVFFELLTREKPYKAAGMIEMAMKHATAPVPSARNLNPEMPEVLDNAIQKMLAKAPEDRYQSLAEVLTLLEKLLLEMQVQRLGVAAVRNMEPLPPAPPAQVVPATAPAGTKPGDKTSSEKTKPKSDEKQASRAEKSPEKPAVKPVEKPAEKAPAKIAARPAEKSAQAKSDYADDFESFISDRPTLKPSGTAAKSEPAKKENAAKTALPEIEKEIDPLDDLLDTLLAETRPVEPQSAYKKAAEDAVAKAAADELRKTAESAMESTAAVLKAVDATAALRPDMPQNFNEDVTTDIDAVFQSRVRAEAAAMAQATQAAKEAAEIGKAVPGPAAAKLEGSSGSRPAAGSAAKVRQPQVNWIFKTSGPIGWSSAPVLSRDRKTLYVASCDGWCYALDVNKGNVLWRVDTGSALMASPVVAEDRIFIACTNGALVAITPSGSKLWETASTSPLVATPVLHGQDLLLASMDGSLKYVSGKDGAVKWTYRTDGPLVSPPHVLDTLVFVTSKDKCLHAVSLDRGWRQWCFTTEAAIVSSPLVSTDSVYVGSTDGNMYAVEAESGKMIWRYPTENPIVSKGTLEFTSVTVCSEDKWVHCIEKYTGLLVWKSRLYSPVMASLVSNGGNLYIANRENWLQCFNLKNGDLKWQLDCSARLESPPLVVGKTLYIGKVNGEIASYEIPT
jgi:serine/threonine protein kinase/outer membrane protein assembly factor BamB